MRLKYVSSLWPQPCTEYFSCDDPSSKHHIFLPSRPGRFHYPLSDIPMNLLLESVSWAPWMGLPRLTMGAKTVAATEFVLFTIVFSTQKWKRRQKSLVVKRIPPLEFQNLHDLLERQATRLTRASYGLPQIDTDNSAFGPLEDLASISRTPWFSGISRHNNQPYVDSCEVEYDLNPVIYPNMQDSRTIREALERRNVTVPNTASMIISR